MQAKHPERQREIGQDIYDYVADKELHISIEKILPKLDLISAPRPTTGFWNRYLRMWTRLFAPASAEEATRHLETRISDMASGKTPRWFMQSMHPAKIIAIVKDIPPPGILADHRPMVLLDTLGKIADKAIRMPF